MRSRGLGAALLGWALVLAMPAPAAAAAPIRVGTYANEPLIFRDAGGAPRGIYVDLLEHVAGRQGWTLQWVEGTWEECLGRLQRGEIDLLVAIGYSAERSRLFDFTAEPVVVNWGQVYVRRDSDIRSLLDLTGRTLAVVRGDIYYESLRSTHAILKVFPTFVEVDAYADTLRLVAKRQADAALVPRIFGAYHQRKSKLEKTSIMFSPVELRFAAPKGRKKELLAALDGDLRALKADPRSVYHRSLGVWIEGVQTLVFPKWVNPRWVVVGTVSSVLLVVAMNFLLRRLVRQRTAALKASLAAQAKIASELRIARDIQMSFIPRVYPTLPGYDIHGTLQPAREVGGDFYDCFLLDDHHLYFVLGDVSDKGVPAALFMAVTKTLLGASAAASDSPAAILAYVNHQTSLNNDGCMFVTVFCGILDVRTGRVVYANAGHNPPAVLRAGGRVDLLESGRAPALGIDDDASYGVYDVTLEPGDFLFMYTDGVTEAVDRKGDLFSDDRLRTELSACHPRDSQGLAAEVVRQVMAFSDGVPQADDIALLVVQRSRPARFRLDSRLGEIERLAGEVTRLGQAHGLPAETVFDLNLALEETVSNIIRHGYAGRAGHGVSVTVHLAGESIAVTVEDDAAPFDPSKHPAPDLTVPLEDRPDGGMGVYLIRRLMDEVDYRREEGRNVLTLKKRIRRSACR